MKNYSTARGGSQFKEMIHNLNKPTTIEISAHVPEDLHKKLMARTQQGVPVDNIIEEALRRYFNER